MKNYLLGVAMLFATLSFAQTAPKINPITEAHKTAHHITMPTLAWGGGSCSATAIAPHALLTATHCTNQPSAVVSVDGTNTKIDGILSDGLDHSIILVNEEFKSFASFGDFSKTVQGDDVFVFGNPGGMEDILRKGYVAVYAKPQKVETPLQALVTPPAIADNEAVKTTFYDFNGYFGDSGSGIFNAEGKLIAVTSFLEATSEGAPMKMMGGWVLNFSVEQIKQVQDFKPVVTATLPPPVKKHKSILDWFSTEDQN